MARRRAGKAKPRNTVGRDAAGRGRQKSSDLQERLAALERERDTLRAALEVEQARRQRLEQVHATTRDRIAWALDTLQSILDAKS